MSDSDVVDATARGAFDVVYQPILGLRSGEIVGHEALVRFDPGLSTQGDTARAIEIATRAGRLETVFERVLGSVASAAAEDLLVGYTSVNVNASLIADGTVWKHLIRTELDPRTLVVELSEQEATDVTVPEVQANLRQLRDAGVRIAIDDLGTGYSDLASLVRLAPEMVKIDRSLTHELPAATWHELFEMIVAMGHRIGATVVAEGVETVEQFEALRSVDTDGVQGYLIGRPSAQPAGHAPGQATPTVESRPLRIGIVDDDPRLVGLVADMLEDDGHRVVVQATSSQEFLRSLRVQPVDVAIVDLVLSQMENAMDTVVRPLRTLRPDIQVVVFSSMFDPDMRIAAESEGCTWVEKPKGPEALAYALADAARRDLA